MQKLSSDIKHTTPSFLDWADSIDEPLAMLDSCGEFVVQNKAMAALLGRVGPPGSKGCSLFDLLDAQTSASVLSLWDVRLVVQRQKLTFTASAVGASVEHAMLWKVHPHGDEGDVLLSVNDIKAELALLDPSLREALVPGAHRSQTAIDRTLARVTHDMKAPLRRINVFGELVISQLKKGEVTPDCLEHMRCVVSNATHHINLLHAMNAYLEFNDAPRPTHLTTLDHILRSACEHANFEIGQMTRGGHLGEELCVQEGLLTEVLTELLANTLRFCHTQRERRVELDVHHDAETRRWHITYRDHGPGVDAAHHDIMFEPFERLSPQPHKSLQGFGLGLALCRTRMSMMRGDIKAMSLPDGGMAVALTFIEA